MEFGLTRENGDIKAYGAGLLSSFGELEYSLSDKPTVLPFDPRVAGNTDYPITEYQPTYFVTDSFQDSTRLMREFAAQSDRPFTVHYNAYTQTVEVLDTVEKIVRFADQVQQSMSIVSSALKTLSWNQKTKTKKQKKQKKKQCACD